jgi:hypothetical protein
LQAIYRRVSINGLSPSLFSLPFPSSITLWCNVQYLLYIHVYRLARRRADIMKWWIEKHKEDLCMFYVLKIFSLSHCNVAQIPLLMMQSFILPLFCVAASTTAYTRVCEKVREGKLFRFLSFYGNRFTLRPESKKSINCSCRIY